MARGTRKDDIDTLALRYWNNDPGDSQGRIRAAMVRRFGQSRTIRAINDMRKTLRLLRP